MSITFLLRYIDSANLITAINAAVGFLAIVLFLNDEQLFGISFIILAACLDHIDGWVARSFYSEDQKAREFGRHLDTLADAVCFSMTPAILLIILCNHSWLSILSGLFFLITGLGRLAHFEIVGAEGGRKYSGLPTTYAAYFFVIRPF